MPPDQFGITLKQAEVCAAVRDAPITGVEEIYLIGAIGTSKTFVMAYAHINIALQFDGSVIPVGRKDAAEHQIGTFLSYLEVLEKMGMVEGTDYRLRQATNDLQIRIGRSIIKFIGMNKSRDREWSKLKIMATAAGVDEADDVEEDGCDMLYSRTGRKNENGAPRIMIYCCNPNDRWIKNKIYIPWKKREGKLPPDLDDDSIEPLDQKKIVIEFQMEDSPLHPTGYYDRFMARPKWWRERYLRNNWFFLDDEKSLFKARTLDTLTISRLKQAEKYIAVDPNAGGPDKAAIVLWEGDTVVDAEVYTSEQLRALAEPQECDPMNYGAVLGRLTRAMMAREGVGYLNVGGDVVGVGQGWLTDMLAHGMKVLQFRSGDAPIPTAVEKAKGIKPPYGMLRDQMYYLWSQDLTAAQVFFYSGMPHLSFLKKELQLHEGDDTTKVMRVIPKDDVKLMLGHSPDIADAAMMAYWVRYIRKGRPSTASSGHGVGSVGNSYESIYNASNGF